MRCLLDFKQGISFIYKPRYISPSLQIWLHKSVCYFSSSFRIPGQEFTAVCDKQPSCVYIYSSSTNYLSISML